MPIMEICCQNTVALRVDYDRELHAIVKVLDMPRADLAPFAARSVDGGVTKRGLTEWWHNRAIPVTRDGYEQLRGDLFGTDRLELLDDSFGLSLSDQFWMRPAESGISWEDVNFFDNDFDGSLGLLTLGSFGSLENNVLSGGFSGPNASLGGNLRKAWEIRGDGARILVKSGTAPFRQEPANELIATLLYKRVLDREDFVPYGIEVRDGKAYSVCENMVSRDECLVPAWDIVSAFKMPGHISPWQHVVNCYEELGIHDAERQLSKMIACDYILANSDRHWNNFGLVFDARTMEAKRVAPIFDTGTSLWCWASSLDVEKDYWYRPLPMIRERANRIYPENQLDLVKDFGWLDPVMLAGFAEEAEGVLRECTNLPEPRVSSIVACVRKNIEGVEFRARRAHVAHEASESYEKASSIAQAVGEGGVDGLGIRL